MTQRLKPTPAYLTMIKPLIDFSMYTRDGLDPALVELVNMRASQINGCARCLHWHLPDARKAGLSEEKLHLLVGWRDSSLYSERERAALEWTEALTHVAETRAPDAAYAAVKAQFTTEEQIKLTLLIGAINAFNRLNVGFRIEHAKSAMTKEAA